jgi:biotin/methionine sulfoxide reductase
MGTDVALMLGIAHTLVENGWQDDAFLPAAPAAMTFLPAI